MIHTTRKDLADILWRYGEDALAARVANERDVSKDQLDLVGNVAQRYALSDEHALASERGMLIDQALAHGAVEVLEGQERKLARKRRRTKPGLRNPS